MKGVKPEEEDIEVVGEELACWSRAGPGSEKRTRFLERFGV